MDQSANQSMSQPTKKPKIVTRFAPSPTGLLHAGNYRTALFSYLFARGQHASHDTTADDTKGSFVLRIEDTDKARSKKEYEDNIIESLKWLGLEYDSFSRQSDNTHVYKKYIEQLIASGHAYVSQEKVTEEGQRSSVIRFKNPNKKVQFNDLIRGVIEFDTTELGDFIIARTMDEPVFHLVVVIDDYLTSVTHIIRGEDHISNTPRHILLYEALGFPVPLYAHLPLLLAKDRTKLSKRKGARPITDYRDMGYVREAVVNYLALLGWNPGDAAKDQEIFSLPELIHLFKLEKVQKSAAVFDEEKMAWYNKQYINKMSDVDFLSHVHPYLHALGLTHIAENNVLLALIKDKIHTFGEIPALFAEAGELTFIKGSRTPEAMPTYPTTLLYWKKEPDISKAGEHARLHIAFVIDTLKNLQKSTADTATPSLTPEVVKSAIWAYAEEKGRGNVLWPMRVALSGQEKSPDPFTIVALLGIEESIKRLQTAYEKLS